MSEYGMVNWHKYKEWGKIGNEMRCKFRRKSVTGKNRAGCYRFCRRQEWKQLVAATTGQQLNRTTKHLGKKVSQGVKVSTFLELRNILSKFRQQGGGRQHAFGNKQTES
jgi:hypothetical protein